MRILVRIEVFSFVNHNNRPLLMNHSKRFPSLLISQHSGDSGKGGMSLLVKIYYLYIRFFLHKHKINTLDIEF